MPFSFQASGETAHASIFPHHPMARNDDRHRISASGRASRADGLGRACAPGQFAVIDGFAMRDERDFPPDPLLEIGARQAQRD